MKLHEMVIPDEVPGLRGAKSEGEALKGKLDDARKMLSKPMPEELIIRLSGFRGSVKKV